MKCINGRLVTGTLYITCGECEELNSSLTKPTHVRLASAYNFKVKKILLRSRYHLHVLHIWWELNKTVT